MLDKETAMRLSLEQLISRYNDVIETIWYLEYSLKELTEEYDLLFVSYEELTDKLFG